MTWLLKLYPPRWRRRYGEEFVQVMSAQPISFSAAIDIIAGAIDAWIHPAVVPATAATKEGANMLAKMMRLRCVGYGPTITAADVWKSLVVTLGGTVVLTLAWMWARRRFDDNPYIESVSQMALFLPILVGLRYTSLKGRSAGVQAVFIVGLTVILLTMSLAAPWIGARW